jgi:hypothetical protein
LTSLQSWENRCDTWPHISISFLRTIEPSLIMCALLMWCCYTFCALKSDTDVTVQGICHHPFWIVVSRDVGVTSFVRTEFNSRITHLFQNK